MRLDEIELTTAAERRVDRLKDSAASLTDKAKKLRTQASAEAERLRVTRSHEGPERTKKAGATAMIKPH